MVVANIHEQWVDPNAIKADRFREVGPKKKELKRYRSQTTESVFFFF